MKALRCDDTKLHLVLDAPRPVPGDGEVLVPEITGDPTDSPPKRKKPPKFLRVQVNSHDGDVVNIRVPMALVRTGVKLTTMLPNDAKEKMEEHGVDLSNLNGLQGDELIEALPGAPRSGLRLDVGHVLFSHAQFTTFSSHRDRPTVRMVSSITPIRMSARPP